MPIPHRSPALVASLTAALFIASPVACQETTGVLRPGRESVEHKLLSPGQTDVWPLTVAADEMLWCRVDSDAFDPVVTCVDGSGRELGRHDGEGTRSELWLRAENPGPLEFRVAPFRGSGGGRYRIELLRFRTAPLAAQGSAEHVFGKEAWWHWRMPLQAGEVVVATVTGAGRLVAALGPDREPLTLHGGVFTASRTGDHYLRVEGDEEARCQVRTQRARCGDRAVAVAHEEAVPAFGLDRWRFRVTAGTGIVLAVRMPIAALAVVVHEPGGDPRTPGFVATGHFDKGGDVRRLFFVRRDTTLELQLRHVGDAEAPYTMALQTRGAPLRLGADIEGALALGDGALHALDLTAGEMVDLQAHSAQFDASLDLWDPDGNVLASVDDRGLVDRDPRHRFLVARGGRYHVLVHCRGGLGAGAFTLRATTEPLPRLQPGEALAVEPGAYVHLDLDAGQVVWLAVTSRAFDAALQVVDPAGDGVFVAEGGGVDGDVLVAHRARLRGRHVLVVQTRSGVGAGTLRVVAP